MDFNDSPQEAEFRGACRSFLEANAKRSEGGPGVWRWQGKMSLADAVARAREWQGKKADAGYAVHALAQGVRRRGPARSCTHHLRPGGVEVRRAARVLRHRLEHLRAGDDGLRHRGAEEALPAQDGARRGGLVPALLRAGRRLRPRRPAHARRARRRRVGGERPEGLELGRALLRLGDPGHAPRPDARQAQGPHVLLRRHEDARASRRVRSGRSPAPPASTRCSSPTCASPTRSASARSATAGRSRSRR